MFAELYASLSNLFFSVQAIHQKKHNDLTPSPFAFGEWVLLSVTTLFYSLKKQKTKDTSAHTFTM